MPVAEFQSAILPLLQFAADGAENKFPEAIGFIAGT
jgi:hypothetical protein